MKTTLRNVVEGPKTARFPTALKNLAFMYDLELTMDVDSGFWFETVRYTVTGEEDKVYDFWDHVKFAIEEYNSVRKY